MVDSALIFHTKSESIPIPRMPPILSHVLEIVWINTIFVVVKTLDNSAH
jgi:hypothetical protein